jgi:hypothetical protein
MSFLDESFDAVLCNLGLMFFPTRCLVCRSFVAYFAPAGAQPSQ